MWNDFNYDGAKERFDRTLEVTPNFADAYLWLESYWTYVRLDYEDALFHVTEAVRFGGRPTPWLGMLAAFFGATGDAEKAEETFKEMQGRAGFWMAVAQGGQGDFMRAFSSLERAVEERDSNLVYLMAAPRALGFHDRPEFSTILHRVGLGHLTAFL